MINAFAKYGCVISRSFVGQPEVYRMHQAPEARLLPRSGSVKVPLDKITKKTSRPTALPKWVQIMH